MASTGSCLLRVAVIGLLRKKQHNISKYTTIITFTTYFSGEVTCQDIINESGGGYTRGSVRDDNANNEHSSYRRPHSRSDLTARTDDEIAYFTVR